MSQINTILLKERVKHTVEFHSLSDGALWYMTNDKWLFPIPLSDTAGAAFQRTEKGILLMKWIRRAMETEAINRAEAQTNEDTQRAQNDCG